jgi:hypothetical protein
LIRKDDSMYGEKMLQSDDGNSNHVWPDSCHFKNASLNDGIDKLRQASRNEPCYAVLPQSCWLPTDVQSLSIYVFICGSISIAEWALCNVEVKKRH